MVRTSLDPMGELKSNSSFKLTLTLSIKRTRTELKTRTRTRTQIKLECVSLSPTPSSTLTNSRTSYLKKRTRNQKEKYGTFPLLIIPVHVFQTAFSLINWGKWLRTSSPGPVPYCPFLFSLPHPPLFPAPTVLDSPYSPPVLSLDHVLRCELP